MGTEPQHGDEPAQSAVAQLAGALHALRLARGLTIEEFCSLTGLSRMRVAMIEGGQGIPARDTLQAYFETCQPPRAKRRAVRALFEQAREEGPPAGDAEKVVELAEQRLPAGKDQKGQRTAIVPVPITPITSPAKDVVDISAMQSLVITRRGDGQVNVHHRREQPTVHERLVKPAWRRSTMASEARPELWPHPEDLRMPAEFTEALLAIRASTAMSYKALADATGRMGFPLGRSTVHAMCHKKTIPSNPQAVRCFIRVCGGSDADADRWVDAWQRIKQATASEGDVADIPTVDMPAVGVVFRQDEPELDISSPRAGTPGLKGWPVRGHKLLHTLVFLVVFVLGIAVGAFLF